MRAWLAAALLGVVTPAAALVEAEHFEVMGSARTFTLLTQATVPTPIGAVDVDAAAHLARLRLNGKAWWGPLELVVAGDAVINTGLSAFGAIAAPSALRLWELGGVHIGDNYTLAPDLDRLLVVWLGPGFEVRLGRQAISHGSARVFPTTDVFAPLTAFTLDTEYKRGVDALRVTVPWGANSEVEAYAVGHSALDQGLYLGRVRTTVAQALDASALLGYTRGALSVGLDLQGDLAGAGWYAEGWSRPGEGVEGLRGTVGATYKWADWDLTGTAELHYNGAGGHPDALAYTSGEATFGDRVYGAVLLDWAWTPLVNLGLAYFQNAEDGSAIVAPSLAWSVADEAAVGLGAFVGLGEDGELGRASMGFGDVRVYF